MSAKTIEYRMKSASLKDITSHLSSGNENFAKSLEQRVKINDYAKKIFANSMTFEAWEGKKLIGLLAVYCNDRDKKFKAFITNVSVDTKYLGQGIASAMMNQCLSHIKESTLKTIELNVAADNIPAIELYKKFGFTTITEDKNSLLMIKENVR